MTEKPIPFALWETLLKIEFHETKVAGYLRAGIETQFYIRAEPNRLHDFLKWCDGENWKHNYQEEEFKMKCEQAMRSKRDNPHFQMFINGMHCEVYPKQSYVSVYEIGLHYICQHSFDILPSPSKDLFYAYGYEEKPIGKLYPKIRCGLKRCGQHLESLVVKNSDILAGFMQSAEENKKYDDSFVEWIKHRRFKEIK
jgi:hypothetical protein